MALNNETTNEQLNVTNEKVIIKRKMNYYHQKKTLYFKYYLEKQEVKK